MQVVGGLTSYLIFSHGTKTKRIVTFSQLDNRTSAIGYRAFWTVLKGHVSGYINDDIFKTIKPFGCHPLLTTPTSI